MTGVTKELHDAHQEIVQAVAGLVQDTAKKYNVSAQHLWQGIAILATQSGSDDPIQILWMP